MMVSLCSRFKQDKQSLTSRIQSTNRTGKEKRNSILHESPTQNFQTFSKYIQNSTNHSNYYSYIYKLEYVADIKFKIMTPIKHEILTINKR